MSEKQQWAQLKFGILHSVTYPFYPQVAQAHYESREQHYPT